MSDWADERAEECVEGILAIAGDAALRKQTRALATALRAAEQRGFESGSSYMRDKALELAQKFTVTTCFDDAIRALPLTAKPTE